MKTFSIVIPVYNVSAYIAETIRSVINQKEKDYELIVVDDGSPDDSGTIASKLLSQTSLDYQIVRTENRGVSAARNTGLELCKGQYIVMVDGDDVLESDFLTTYRKLIETCPGNDIYSTSFTIYTADKVIVQPSQNDMVTTYGPKQAQIAFFNRCPRFLLPTMLFRSTFLNSTHPIRFDETVKYSEDVQFIWRVLAYNVKSVIHANYSGYKYILHPGSTMTASGVSKIMTWHEGFEKLYNEVNILLSNEIKDSFVSRGYLAMLHGISKMTTYKEYKEIYDKVNCAEKLKFNSVEASNKVKLVTRITMSCPYLGYCIMKIF